VETVLPPVAPALYSAVHKLDYISAFHKICPQYGEGRFFRCGRPKFLLQRTLKFFENYGTSARTSQCRHFVDKGRGVNFSRFCANVISERSLTIIICFNIIQYTTIAMLPNELVLHVSFRGLLGLREFSPSLHPMEGVE